MPTKSGRPSAASRPGIRMYVSSGRPASNAAAFCVCGWTGWLAGWLAVCSGFHFVQCIRSKRHLLIMDLLLCCCCLLASCTYRRRFDWPIRPRFISAASTNCSVATKTMRMIRISKIRIKMIQQQKKKKKPNNKNKMTLQQHSWHHHQKQHHCWLRRKCQEYAARAATTSKNNNSSSCCHNLFAYQPAHVSTDPLVAEYILD
jgi:hypothetical protein